MQFLVVAWDGRDDGALARRMAVRDAHIENVRTLREQGRIREGGALINDDGKMIGSAVIADFPSRAELDAWLNNDPYVTGKVWEKINVTAFKPAFSPPDK